MLVGSSRFRWVPLALLSLWAASDLAFQYALASTSLPGALGLSKHQLRLIKVESADILLTIIFCPQAVCLTM